MTGRLHLELGEDAVLYLGASGALLIPGDARRLAGEVGDCVVGGGTLTQAVEGLLRLGLTRLPSFVLVGLPDGPSPHFLALVRGTGWVSFVGGPGESVTITGRGYSTWRERLVPVGTRFWTAGFEDTGADDAETDSTGAGSGADPWVGGVAVLPVRKITRGLLGCGAVGDGEGDRQLPTATELPHASPLDMPPAAQPVPAQVAQPALAPVTKLRSAPEPVAEPIAEPAAEPIAEPAAEPVAGPLAVPEREAGPIETPRLETDPYAAGIAGHEAFIREMSQPVLVRALPPLADADPRGEDTFYSVEEDADGEDPVSDPQREAEDEEKEEEENFSTQSRPARQADALNSGAGAGVGERQRAWRNLPEDYAGPIVQAVACPAWHSNPPSAATCRTCGAPVEAQLTVIIPRPSLGWLLFNDDRRVQLHTSVFVGRTGGEPGDLGEEVQIVAVADHHGKVSRRHLLVRIRDWEVLAVDLHSTNGTWIQRPDEEPIRLRPFVEERLTADTRVMLSPDVGFLLEVS